MTTTTPRAAALVTARPQASPWPVFWIASIAVFLVSLDSTMLFAAFSAIRAGFPGTSPADMSWVLNGYTVVYAAMLIPAGGIADTHGRKKVFLSASRCFSPRRLPAGWQAAWTGWSRRASCRPWARPS